MISDGESQQQLARFVSLLQPGVTRARLRGEHAGDVGIYLAYHPNLEAPFEFRLIIDGETRFARLSEFTLLPNASM